MCGKRRILSLRAEDFRSLADLADGPNSGKFIGRTELSYRTSDDLATAESAREASFISVRRVTPRRREKFDDRQETIG